ncbi:MAG: hypothetical protein ACREWE_00020 [Gammaproteobacteria bacterium]
MVEPRDARSSSDRAPRHLNNVGFRAQFHVFVDDLTPTSLGRPIFGLRR